jgi:hypothetical protein
MNIESPAQTSPRLASLPGDKNRTVQDPLPFSYGEDKPTLSRPSRTPILIAFGVALLALTMWAATAQWWGPGALRRLPSEERAGLYQRTLENLEQVCRTNDRPRAFCKEQANNLLALPECEAACQARAREELLLDSAVK